MAKRAGIDEPTEREKDPAFLALQVKALRQAIEHTNTVNKKNLLEIQRAFSMSDIHQQVLARIARDLTQGLVTVRKRQVDGDVTLSTEDFSPLKLNEAGLLDVPAYYAEFRETVQTAGLELGDAAAVMWSQGASVTEAVERAKLKKSQPQVSEEDTNYETEYFGGNNGQNHHQQDPQAAQEVG